PWQPDVLSLDGDAAFPLDVHPVQVLGAHIAVRDDTGELQHPVGQRRLAVVDVGDDAEVPNLRRRGEGLVGETANWESPGGRGTGTGNDLSRVTSRRHRDT